MRYSQIYIQLNLSNCILIYLYVLLNSIAQQKGSIERQEPSECDDVWDDDVIVKVIQTSW